LFFSTLFFTMSISEKRQDIAGHGETLKLKEAQLAENQTMMSSIQSLEEQLGKYKSSMALYDSLVPGAERWSTVFTQLSHGVEDLNSIWLSDFASTDAGTLTLNGFTVYRTRIPRLSTLFENSLLKEVSVQQIRDETVYRYKIEVPPQRVTK
jgi:Tfp pilus assembly protein PilN